MKALTLIRPWCWAIAHAGKDVENRTWKPPASIIGQRIAIHSGMKWDECAHIPNKNSVSSAYRESSVYWIMTESETTCPIEDIGWPGGRIVATAKLTGWTLAAESRWAVPGQVHWCLHHVIALPEPVPCRGAQGLWTVPEAVAEKVAEQEARGTK